MNACHKAVTGKNDDDDADDAVDEPHGSNIEVGAHLIDKESDDRPPQQCAQDNESIAQDDVIELVLGQRESKTCKQGDNQEHDERIAQCKQESRDDITQVIVALVDVLLDLADRVMENHVQRIYNQDDATHNLQYIDMVGNEVSDQRDAESHQQTVEQVTGSSSDSRKETRPAALVQGALDAQDPDWTHGCRQDDTY